MSINHTIRKTQLGIEVELMRGLTHLPEAPYASAALRLLEAGASHLHYVVGVDGGTFGVELAGSGSRVAASMAHELAAITRPALGERLIAALGRVDELRTHFELSLGRSPHLSMGMDLTDPALAREVLRSDGVPASEVERVLADTGHDGLRALTLWVLPTGEVHWVVWSLGPPSFELGIPAELGEKGVFKGLVCGRSDTTWLRRDSPASLELIDWLFTAGYRGDYAARLGRVHAQLEVAAPVRLRFAVDELQDTLTLHYPSMVVG